MLKKRIKVGLFVAIVVLLSLIFTAKAQALQSEELETIKNDRFFSGQGASVFFDLDQAKEMIVKNRREIDSMEEQINSKQEDIKKDIENSKKLIRDLYISGYEQSIIYSIATLLHLDSFLSDEIGIRGAYTKISQRVRESKNQEEKSQAMLESLYLKRSNIESQIDYLEESLANLRNSDTQTNESQLINTNAPTYPQNNRDFINWNRVDFGLASSMTIYGAGTAHGIGMSQYGAKAMAEKGADFQSILKHYYQGVELKKIDTEKRVVRIRLSTSPSGGNITVRGDKATLIKPDGSTQLLNAGESILASAGIKLTPQSGATRFEIGYKTNSFKTYRGIIDIMPSGGSLLTINSIYIEDYLKSVISGEMSASWPIEALKAQAVAARNYALKNINLSKSYDLCDTPACQVYLGASYEFPSTDLAVEQTRGQVIYYGGELVTAYYFSSSGGWTENNENVWGGTPIPYLRGVESPNENSPYNSWKTDSISKSDLEIYLNSNPKTAVGSLKTIEIVKRGVSGRVMAVKISGSNGEKVVSGNTFKTAINLGLPDEEDDYVKEILFGIK